MTVDIGDASPATDLATLGERLRALGACSVPGGTAQKRFIRNVAGKAPETLSARQAAYVEILCWTYRRQLPPRLVPASKPPALPKP